MELGQIAYIKSKDRADDLEFVPVYVIFKLMFLYKWIHMYLQAGWPQLYAYPFFKYE